MVDIAKAGRIGEDVEAVLAELRYFEVAEGGYDIKRAFEQGLGSAVYEAKGYGLFTDEDINTARTTGQIVYIKEPSEFKEARRHLAEFEGLKGEARITKARELKLLPKDFEELPQELKTAYGISDKAFNTAVEDYNRRIETETRKVEAEAVTFEAANVKLATTGEYIAKAEFEGLSKEHQTLLHNIGIDKFNIQQEKALEAELAKTVKLSTGERIDKVEYNALSPYDQNFLMLIGIDKFNALKQQEVTKFESEHKKIAVTGEYIPLADYNALNPEQRTYLRAYGVDKFNKKWGEAPVESSVVNVEIDTPVGVVTMPQKEWEAMPEMKQIEVALNRPPTVEEWVAYSLDRDKIKTPWYGMFPGIYQIIASAQTYIPGEQAGEKALLARIKAQEEWYRQYPELKGHGIVESIAGDLGFPAIKSIYPTITVRDVTGKEYAVSALSAAMWSMPIWAPKLIKVAWKPKVTTKTPILRFQSPVKKIQVGFGQTKLTFKSPIKVTWGAGLQRAGVPKNVEILAIKSGQAAQNLKTVTAVASKYKGLLPPQIASNLKTVQLASRAADIKFINSITGLKLTSQQIKLISQVTGYKNLNTLILNVSKANIALTNAWKVVDRAKVGTVAHTKALVQVEKARVVLGQAVDKLDDVLRPRYTQSPPAPRFDGYKMKWSEQTGTYLPDSPAPVKTAYEAAYGSKTPLPPDVYQKNYAKMIDSFHTAKPYEMPKTGTITAPATQAQLTGLEQLYRTSTLSVLKTSPIYTEQLAPQFMAGGLPAFSAQRSFAGLVAPPLVMRPAAEFEAPIPTVIPATMPDILPAVMTKLNITQEQLTGVQPLSASQIDTIARVAAVTKEEVQTAAKTGTLTKILVVPKVAEALQVGVAITPAEMTALETDVALQTATQVATKAMTETLAQGATLVEAQTAAQVALKALTLTEAQAVMAMKFATATVTGVVVTPTTAIPPPIPWLEQPSWVMGKPKVEKGVIAWRQGIFWITMPPPYTKTYYSKQAPEGAYKFAVGEDSPYKTIQIIGGMPDKDITDIDIGIAIVDIRRKGKELTIHFKQDVEDAYKGKEVKEPITTYKRPGSSLKYHSDESGKLVIDQEPKKRFGKPKPMPAEELLPAGFDEPTPTKRKKVEKITPIGDRYYLGHKLPDSNIRVNL